MGFIERLRQEETAKALRAEQLKIQQEASEKVRLQKEADACERHAKRREQAEKFREESGVSLTVDELVKFLETPTIPVECWEYSGEDLVPHTEYIGRGSRSTSAMTIPGSPKDADSVCDTVQWDLTNRDLISPYKTSDSKSKHSQKYITVETCPDGTIVFHGGSFGSTTVRLSEWRTTRKEQVFDNALERAYRNPWVHKFEVSHPLPSPGFG